MMSLAEANVLVNAKKQYNYKLKANASFFFTLISVQLVAILLSFNGVGSMGTGSEGISIVVKYISGDMIIIFTILWAFVIGLNLATNAFRLDFTFVSNRLSSNLSSIYILLTAAVVGGVSATLSGILLRVLVVLLNGSASLGSGLYIAPLTLLGGIYVTILYVLLLSSFGYFSGILGQRNKALTILIPALVLGTMFAETRSSGNPQLFLTMVQFFTAERSYLLITLKISLVAALLFGCVILLSEKLEVRR